MIVIKLKVQSKSIFYLVKAGRSNSRGIIWKSKNKSKRREEPFIPSTARPLSAAQRTAQIAQSTSWNTNFIIISWDG